jgi:hypothetical protein
MEESDDYIPKSDAEFDAGWTTSSRLPGNASMNYPMSEEELAALEATRDEWKISYAANLEAEAKATAAEREHTKLTHKGKVDPRERMDSGLLPLVRGVELNDQLQELMRRHTGPSLRKMMRPEEDHTGDDES